MEQNNTTTGVKKTILIIDDSSTIIDMLTLTLEKFNYKVLSASGGAEGLGHLTGQRIDLIISDLYMPEPNGIELTKIVKSNPEYKATPVLLLTTESDREYKMKAKVAGASGWITKPFSPDKLLTAVKTVLK